MAKRLRGCGVYIFSDDGARMLLSQRGPGARHEHYKWEGTGGQLDGDETYAEAARREVREELGVDVELGNMIATFEEISDSNGDVWEAKVFAGSIDGVPAVQEPTKCVGFGWFTKAEVAEMRKAGLLADYAVKDMLQFGWL